jgi:hypothetical protein
MAHEEHEGRNSVKRVASFVGGRGLENFALSVASLAEDLDWADVVLSEYSQTLIDALRLGKWGLIANMTGRRSFMKCFEDLGFASASGYGELKGLLGKIAADPAGFGRAQNEAVKRYNGELEKRFSSGGRSQ